ncbi:MULTISPECIES: hypothetical protein [Brevundimonas]|jgi:hypothetical protein|uniref:hypothetical protein n=1 Tax=Brevundimonas TaxID=41275 RepID=UPI001E47BF1D|nr:MULTISPECIES: hypothetical protein [Brevundimonas]
MGKSSLAWVVAAAFVAASCSSAPTPDSPVRTPVASAPATEVVDYAAATQPIGTRMPQMDGDLCRAAELQSLVGQPRTEIPVPVDVINRRVACTTCPITEDYSPYRLNIFFDQETGIVEEVRCG